MKIKKADKVFVTAGKDSGKVGTVEMVSPKRGRVVVTGLNIRKKHLKKSQKHPKGGIMEFPASMDISNVKLVCPKCNKSTRVGFQTTGDKKERICKRCKGLV